MISSLKGNKSRCTLINNRNKTDSTVLSYVKMHSISYACTRLCSIRFTRKMLPEGAVLISNSVTSAADVPERTGKCMDGDLFLGQK